MSDPDTLYAKLAQTRRSMDTVRPYLRGQSHDEARFALNCLIWRETGLLIKINRYAETP